MAAREEDGWIGDEMKSGWKEVAPGGKSVDIPVGWRKEWSFENVYGWVWYGPPHSMHRDLIVTLGEQSLEQRRAIEARFANAEPPPIPNPERPAYMAVFDEHEKTLRKMAGL